MLMETSAVLHDMLFHVLKLEPYALQGLMVSDHK